MNIALAIVIGAVAGLIINYLADVLPQTRRFSQPTCRACNQPFSMHDYFLSTSCSACGKKRPIRSIIVLGCSIAAAVLLIYFQFANLNIWATFPLLIFFGTIMAIDIEHRLVLIQTSIFGFALFLIYGIYFRGIWSTLLGALAGLLITLVFYFLGIAFTKIAGKVRGEEIDEVAFGFGDVMLGTILGLLTGWPAIAGVIVIAILSFSAFSILFFLWLLLTKRYQAFANGQPFTLFLILGAIVIFYM